MTSDELGISLDSDLARSIRDAAKRSGKDLSDWLAEAAMDKLRNDALGEFLDEWEGGNGHVPQAGVDVRHPDQFSAGSLQQHLLPL